MRAIAVLAIAVSALLFAGAPSEGAEEIMATIEFEPGNPTPDDVYVTGSGYETDRTVKAEITRPDGSIEIQDVGVLFDGGVIGYRWPLSGSGTYHFKHSQARGLHGRNAEIFEVKAEADYVAP